MGSFRDNSHYINYNMGSQEEMLQSDDVSDIFDEYLSQKMEENDIISYFLIRDLYEHYLDALRKNKSEIV